MADRVAVMYLGEVVELASATDLFARPRHPYTAALMAAIPVASFGARRARTPLEGDPPNPIFLPDGCRFHPRCNHASDLCRRTRPTLQPREDGSAVACHHADTMALAGLSDVTARRSPAAQARFARYAAALAGSTTTENSPKTGGTTPSTDGGTI
jgi:oligopeptide/dipeptide ABC transporter ATP-binding protein